MDEPHPRSLRRTKLLTALPNVPSHLRAESIASIDSTTGTITTSNDSAESNSPPSSPSTSSSNKPGKQVRFDPEPIRLSFFDWDEGVEVPEVQPKPRWLASRNNYRRSWSSRQASPPPPVRQVREDPVNVGAAAESDEFAAWLKRSSRVGMDAFTEGGSEARPAEMEAAADSAKARRKKKGEVKKKRRSIASFFGLS